MSNNHQADYYTRVLNALRDLAAGGGSGGKSAYEIWLDAGNTGTIQDFLESLIGSQGKDGTDGFSPEITVKTDTDDEYVLTIKTADTEFDTSNLKGSQGMSEIPFATDDEFENGVIGTIPDSKQVQRGLSSVSAFVMPVIETGGTTTAITANVTDWNEVNGSSVRLMMSTAMGANATLSINDGTPHQIRTAMNTPIEANMIASGAIITLVFNNNCFFIQGV